MTALEAWAVSGAGAWQTDGAYLSIHAKSSKASSSSHCVAFPSCPLRIWNQDNRILSSLGQSSSGNSINGSLRRENKTKSRRSDLSKGRTLAAASEDYSNEYTRPANGASTGDFGNAIHVDQARADSFPSNSGMQAPHEKRTPPTAESVFAALGGSLPNPPRPQGSKNSPGTGSKKPTAIPCDSTAAPLQEKGSGMSSLSSGSLNGTALSRNLIEADGEGIQGRALSGQSEQELGRTAAQPSQTEAGVEKASSSQKKPSSHEGEPQWKNAFPAYMQSRESAEGPWPWNGAEYGHAPEEGNHGLANGRAVPGVLGLGIGKAVAAAKAAASKAAEALAAEDCNSSGSGPEAHSLVTPPSSAAQPPVTSGLKMPELINDDPVWAAIRAEAKLEAEREPLLSSFLYASILAHSCFERSVGFVLANRLKNATLLATQLLEVFDDVLMQDSIRHAIRADVQAVKDRDPSCRSYSSALLYYKGYHALQSYRIAHALWRRGQQVLALALQSRISEVFAVDIHPAARIGCGILMDHGTGVVIGETAVVGNRVSMLQGVTLGGTGKEAGDRHPKIHEGVLIGAGATILGNINVGRGAMVAAGSLVLKNVPAHSMVAGTPAKVVGMLEEPTPSLTMKHDVTKNFCAQWEEAVRQQLPEELYEGAGI